MASSVGICDLLGRRWLSAASLIVPLACITYFIIAIVAFQLHEKFESVALDTAAFYGYVISAICSFFLSVDYVHSVLFRQIACVGVMMLNVIRVNIGTIGWSSLIVTWVMIIIMVESNFYVQNKKQVQLFLKTEISNKQESQLNELLYNLPDPVIIITNEK